MASVGTAARTATTLSAPTAVGDSVIKVASVTNMVAGEPVLLDTGANTETATIQTVGTAGATGTGVTLTAPLTLAHASGAAARDIGTGVTFTAPLAAAHASGSAARDLGLGITLTAPISKAHATNAATRDAGTGLVLTAPLTKAHPTGETAITPGTGIELNAPLTLAHAAGDATASTGITVTPALTSDHATGDAVTEPGLVEPAIDTPLPAYYGYKMTSLMTKPGSKITDLGKPVDRVYAFSSYLNGTESIELINTSDTTWKTVSLGTGSASGNTWQTSGYSLEHPAITQGTTTAGALASGITLEPESITVVSGAAATEPTVGVGPSSTVGGTVPATLSLSLGAPASFGAFTPGVAKDYTASTTANVISTAGDATLSVADPSATATGHLVNGAFSLPSALGGLGVIKTWSAPVSNDPVTIAFTQHIGATDALRTGAYSKTLTFTLSTTNP